MSHSLLQHAHKGLSILNTSGIDFSPMLQQQAHYIRISCVHCSMQWSIPPCTGF